MKAELEGNYFVHNFGHLGGDFNNSSNFTLKGIIALNIEGGKLRLKDIVLRDDKGQICSIRGLTNNLIYS